MHVTQKATFYWGQRTGLTIITKWRMRESCCRSRLWKRFASEISKELTPWSCCTVITRDENGGDFREGVWVLRADLLITEHGAFRYFPHLFSCTVLVPWQRERVSCNQLQRAHFIISRSFCFVQTSAIMPLCLLDVILPLWRHATGTWRHRTGVLHFRRKVASSRWFSYVLLCFLPSNPGLRLPGSFHHCSGIFNRFLRSL